MLLVLAERFLELLIALQECLNMAVSVVTLVVTFVLASASFARVAVLLIRVRWSKIAGKETISTGRFASHF